MVTAGVVLTLPFMVGAAWLQQQFWKQPAQVVLPRL
jgi:hypothetical protein